MQVGCRFLFFFCGSHPPLSLSADPRVILCFPQRNGTMRLNVVCFSLMGVLAFQNKRICEGNDDNVVSL